MLPLARFLRKNGYDTINILYPSRKKSLEDLADFVHDKIQKHLNSQSHSPSEQALGTPSEGEGRRLHFVNHSMGGLITRYYIQKYKPKNLGKVIMLSPPNTGSEFADALMNNKALSAPYKFFFGPAGAQLSTSYKHTDKITYPLGVIAGNKSINPLALWALPRKKVGPHDGIVPVARTKIDGMTDHITMPVNHTFMMFKRPVMQQVLHFLKTEKFKHKLT